MTTDITAIDTATTIKCTQSIVMARNCRGTLVGESGGVGMKWYGDSQFIQLASPCNLDHYGTTDITS